MIILAYEEMANHTTKLSMPYIDKVLANWHSKGFKKPEDIKADVPMQKEQANTSKKTNEASYDLNKFNERSLHRELKYERKKKNELQ